MRKKEKDRLFWAVLSLLFLSLMIVMISQKKNLYDDEVFSYGLANHVFDGKIGLSPEFNVVYEPADMLWTSYMTVDEQNRFHYKNVWMNQAIDVHPPLYYAILHTICSFFPGRFSKWFAGSINIIFCLLLLYLVNKIACQLSESESVAKIVSVLFIFCPGIYSMVIFFRMYAVTAFWAASISYLLLKAVKEGIEDRRFYGFVFFVSMGGTLTHYYFLIYLFLCCAAFGFYLLLRKKYKSLICFAGTVCLAEGGVLLIFPDMWNHIFHGYRGIESVENLKNFSLNDYKKHLEFFSEGMNNHLFMGIIWVVLIGYAIYIICCLKKKKADSTVNAVLNLSVFFVCAVYFFLVVKIAVYEEMRYMFPIYAMLFVCVFTGIVSCLTDLNGKTKIKAAFAVTVLILLLNGWKKSDWSLLYRDWGKYTESLGQYGDVNCIYGYDYRDEFLLLVSYMEMKQYKSMTLVNTGQWEQEIIHPYADEKKLLVSFTYHTDEERQKEYLETLLGRSERLHTYREITKPEYHYFMNTYLVQ